MDLTILYIIVYNYIFIFQAEDGIRYGRVTGVQTCALPILVSGDALRQTGAFDFGTALSRAIPSLNFPMRSEERRVGNVCKSRLLCFYLVVTFFISTTYYHTDYRRCVIHVVLYYTIYCL